MWLVLEGTWMRRWWLEKRFSRLEALIVLLLSLDFFLILKGLFP